MRGGGDGDGDGDGDAGQKERRRKRKRTRKKKEIFVVEDARPKMRVPVSAQLKRLRGEIKDIKRPEDSPGFVKDVPDADYRRDGPSAGLEDRQARGDLQRGADSQQERQLQLRHKAWKAKAKRRKEQAFIQKVKLEKQHREARRLQQKYLEPSGDSSPALHVPMVAGVPLQEEFSTPLPHHLLPKSVKMLERGVEIDSAQERGRYGMTEQSAPQLVGSSAAGPRPDAVQATDDDRHSNPLAAAVLGGPSAGHDADASAPLTAAGTAAGDCMLVGDRLVGPGSHVLLRAASRSGRAAERPVRPKCFHVS
jgi:hypothetical protein